MGSTYGVGSLRGLLGAICGERSKLALAMLDELVAAAQRPNGELEVRTRTRGLVCAVLGQLSRSPDPDVAAWPRHARAHLVPLAVADRLAPEVRALRRGAQALVRIADWVTASGCDPLALAPAVMSIAANPIALRWTQALLLGFEAASRGDTSQLSRYGAVIDRTTARAERAIVAAVVQLAAESTAETRLQAADGLSSW